MTLRWGTASARAFADLRGASPVHSLVSLAHRQGGRFIIREIGARYPTESRPNADSGPVSPFSKRERGTEPKPVNDDRVGAHPARRARTGAGDLTSRPVGKVLVHEPHGRGDQDVGPDRGAHPAPTG